MKPLAPAPIRAVALFASAAVAVSAAALVVAGLANRPPAWFLIGFELVLVVTGYLGVLTARGRFQEGVGVTLITLAGITAAASLFGFLGAGRTLLGFDLRPVLFGRLAAAALLGACAGLAVLVRRPDRSFPLLGRAVAFGIICVGIAGGLWFGAPYTAAWHPAVRLALGVVAAAVGLGFFAASVHCAIRAFEFGKLSDE